MLQLANNLNYANIGMQNKTWNLDFLHHRQNEKSDKIIKLSDKSNLNNIKLE